MMFARIIASLEDIAKKSIEAPDDGSQPDFASGYKLDEMIKSAKDIKKRFFRNLYVVEVPIEKNLDCWVPAKVDEATCKALAGPKFDAAKFKELLAQEKPDAAEGEDETLETVSRDKLTGFGLDRQSVAKRFIAVYKESKRTVKKIKGKQKGTLGTLLYLLDLRTVLWLLVFIVLKGMEAFTEPARLYVQQQLIHDAQQENWHELVPLDIYAFLFIHVYDYFMNDAIKAVALARMNMAFEARVKYIVFSAVLTLDTQTLDTRGGPGGATRLVEGDSNELASKLLHRPAEVMSAVCRLYGCAYIVYSTHPTLLWIVIATSLVSVPFFMGAEMLRNRFYRKADRIQSESGDKAREILNDIAAVRDSGQEESELDDFKRSERVRGPFHVILCLINLITWIYRYGGIWRSFARLSDASSTILPCIQFSGVAT